MAGGQADVAGFVAAFTGSHRYVLDFLAEEVLEHQPGQVLALLAIGRSNQAIAGQLVIALDTVKKHVSHIMDKLGAANRTEAVTRARELGLIP